MKIFHIVRNNRNISWFKEIILETLHSGNCDEIFISSGFFTENNNTQMSSQMNLANTKNWLNVANPSSIKVYLKGCYRYTARGEMSNFENNLKAVGFRTQLLPYKNAHHAKVFIAQRNKKPILEIIGSSNFTSKAYGTGGPYNIEADIVICNDTSLETFILSLIQGNSVDGGIMTFDYFEENNFGRTLTAQMEWIRDNLF